MYIFLAILIPIFITLGFYIKHKEEFVKWEIVTPTIATIILIFIAKFITDSIDHKFTEIWGSTVIEIYEEEPWNEWVYQTCTSTCCCDSKGNNCVTTTYDCSYQDDIGPEWYLKTNIGETRSISESYYEKIAKDWGTYRTKVKTIKNHSSNSRAVGSNGTKFENTKVGKESYIWKHKWNNNDNTRTPYASKHKYVNKVKASDVSVFHIDVVTDSEADSMKLFKYPKLESGLKYPTILGENIPYNIQEKFKKLNGKFGPSNQLRLWVLVYKNAPRVVGNYQENYWVQGNKNELVICVSVDEVGIIQWTHSFSWATSNKLTIEARNKLDEIGNLSKNGWLTYYKWLDNNLHRFERREFAEFDYIKVEPSLTSMIIIIVLSIISSIGFNMWVISNEYSNNIPKWRRRY